MIIELDQEADAIYITFKKGMVFRTEAHGDYIIDYDRKGNMLGLEVIRFSVKFRSVEPKKPALVSVRQVA